MKLVTRDYDCKFINFDHQNEEELGNVEITLKDGTIEYEELSNIQYIKW